MSSNEEYLKIYRNVNKFVFTLHSEASIKIKLKCKKYTRVFYDWLINFKLRKMALNTSVLSYCLRMWNLKIKMEVK